MCRRGIRRPDGFSIDSVNRQHIIVRIILSLWQVIFGVCFLESRADSAVFRFMGYNGTRICKRK